MRGAKGALTNDEAGSMRRRAGALKEGKDGSGGRVDGSVDGAAQASRLLAMWRMLAVVGWVVVAVGVWMQHGPQLVADPLTTPFAGGDMDALTNDHRSMNGSPTQTGQHVIVTGGAGYIGSHMAMHLLEHGYAVTIIDNLSRGNAGAVRVLRQNAPRSKRLRFELADVGDEMAMRKAFQRARVRGTPVDAVLHFAAIAFVGESVADPLNYYTNITANTLALLRAMRHEGVNKLVYSSTCATYGNPEVMPITEESPAIPINPYGRAKLASEDIIRDFAQSHADFRAVILRYFNVYGADPKGRLGEYPPPSLVRQGRISTACFAAALGHIPKLQIYGTDFETPDGTCVRDYIHVTDLVDAHHLAMDRALTNPPSLFNIGTGRGVSVREFTAACLDVTGRNITIEELPRRPGDYAKVYASPEKIFKVLGWKAKFIDVREGLATAWKWRSRHVNGYS